MSIKSIVKFFDDVNRLGYDSDAEEIGVEASNDVFKEMSDNFDFAKEVILERIDEKTFAKFLHMTKKTVAFSMMEKGMVGTALLDDIGELDGFLHSCTLSIIGALIKEEIL